MTRFGSLSTHPFQIHFRLPSIRFCAHSRLICASRFICASLTSSMPLSRFIHASFSPHVIHASFSLHPSLFLASPKPLSPHSYLFLVSSIPLSHLIHASFSPHPSPFHFIRAFLASPKPLISSTPLFHFTHASLSPHPCLHLSLTSPIPLSRLTRASFSLPLLPHQASSKRFLPAATLERAY